MKYITWVEVGKQAEIFLKEERGFDDAEFAYVQMTDTSINLEMRMFDDFQSDLPYSQRIYHGHQSFIGTIRDIDVQHALAENDIVNRIWKKLQAVPSRKMRELRVLIEQFENIGNNAHLLKNEQAAQQLLEYREQLEAMKENLLAAPE